MNKSALVYLSSTINRTYSIPIIQLLLGLIPQLLHLLGLSLVFLFQPSSIILSPLPDGLGLFLRLRVT